jgi:hypothetical protein
MCWRAGGKISLSRNDRLRLRRWDNRFVADILTDLLDVSEAALAVGDWEPARGAFEAALDENGDARGATINATKPSAG